MSNDFKWFVGIDWGGEHHQICVLDDHRRELGECSVEHSGQGIAALVAWLNEFASGKPTALAVAIEVPHGALVETLLAHGFQVFSINPKQLDRFRDRHSSGGAKDDRRDAFVLAASLATDRHLFRHLEVDSPFIIRLRELSRTGEDLDREHRRLCKQLRDLLFRYFPAILRLSPAADDQWIWNLLAIAAHPGRAAKLKPSRVDQILKRHHIRRFAAADVCRELRSESLSLAPGAAESIAEHVSVLIPLLQVIQVQRKKISQALKELLEQAHIDDQIKEKTTVTLLTSIPRVGLVVATRLLSEAARCFAENDHAGLRCYAGIAPVTKQSGKSRRVVMRHGCNERVREACYHWARVNVQHDARSRAHYQRLRSAGHSHGRALRGVCDRLLGVLFALLRTNKPYDPNLRLNGLSIANTDALQNT